MFQGLFSTIRQLMYPREFRIGHDAWSDDTSDLATDFDEPTAQPAQGNAPDSPAGEMNKGSFDESLRLLANIGVGIWRLRQKISQAAIDPSPDEMRRARRHLESLCDIMSQSGLQINDHTGENIPEGGVYALKTIAYQPTSGLSRDQVIETIKPSIYFKNRLIQMGEVIVGTPE